MAAKSHAEIPEDVRKLHADFTAEIRKRQVSSSENFDKSVLTLSSGGLAFSLGFLKDFVAIDSAHWPLLLYISWAGLTSATALTMLSFLASAKAQEVQQDKADAYYLGGNDAAFSKPNPWDRRTIWLNRGSGGSFLVGVVLTTLFVALNLERAQSMKDLKHGTAMDGLPAPLMQKMSAPTLVKGLPAPAITAKVPVQPVPANAQAVAPTPSPPLKK